MEMWEATEEGLDELDLPPLLRCEHGHHAITHLGFDGFGPTRVPMARLADGCEVALHEQF